MQHVTLVGIDQGKHSFHVHGQDRTGKAVFRKKLSRKRLLEFFATFHGCTVVMEACAGAHWMARTFSDFGHAVKLISPQFVRPFVKRSKNDFVDAGGICEAATTRTASHSCGPLPLIRSSPSYKDYVRESAERNTRSCGTRPRFALSERIR